ncbi:retropepsin-like domain-containing protein [Peribacillus psychrosaccharolyticus]|uniref:Retropepsin-like domain-containing protein n=1 Tax=Peribacillus psychrosaccharolyticus TaxID=1407 RepID=A0A974NN49_PERPY|nr:retropepsin-like aspartic protease [Peribacillus psychrosaccharolyticus]MEC2056209.1 retropepsin-like aspartic protease [Peribacillus psychrosaccharolyticus]MED3743612.1 retropepsin-like aspartic protease [Peribacillus psychrosaccharolyticus]QQT00608.1 retropepsin-like domain-containing protein [Peribacillus psychrosaccharolyticus]
MKGIEQLVKFNFSLLEMKEEQKAFVSALKLITEGKEYLAIEGLKNLYGESHNLSLQSSCAKILFELYFTKSDWKQLEALGLLDDPNVDQTNRFIAKACSQSEQTTFSFLNDSVCIPMKLSSSGSPTIDVMINGNKICFWLDTGAGMTVISNALAKECDITILKDEVLEVGNSSNQHFSTDLAIINSIVIQDLTILNQPTLVLADDLLMIQNPKTEEIMKIDGIIGWDIIQHVFLEIDYGRKHIVIQKPKRKEEGQNNLFFCGYPIISVKGKNQVPLYFGLDTGANKTHYGQPLLSKIENLKQEKSMILSGGIGDVNERELDRIESLVIYLNENQSIHLLKVREMLTDLAAFFKLDGVFGSDIAKDGGMVIDYTNKKFELVLG